ncbi:primase-helicase family protein [Limisalsivibrio acetivorans]|uniref:primase-helicase family protein n=1 Tax=Limisalsivibrio acetivorans TaxID=1304888 RepID=UPI0003B585B8|nr:primase-helicase family protein [Limisalsivibrio acetivorans]
MSEEKPKLKDELLPLEREKKYILDTKNRPDYRNFIENNWVREVIESHKKIEDIENRAIKKIYQAGAAIWLSPQGRVVYRRNVEADPTEIADDEKVGRVLCSDFKLDKIQLFRNKGSGDTFVRADIAAKDLLVVHEDFTPFAPSEFYYHKGIWRRTSFRPSEYMKVSLQGYKRKQHLWIEKLLINLANENHDYFEWIENWLAGFFQTLEKSNVALVLRGDQGSGKSMFFEYVLKPLFGERHCVVVDQSRIESQFKSWVNEMLFFNLNEVAVDMKGRKHHKNFLKQLVTDHSIQLEEKFTDAEQVQVYGNIYITSNEALPVEIEPTDRRFTVLKTGGPIKEKLNTFELVENIEKELENFAKYLKAYDVDWEMYHTALDTPEKRAIVSGTNSKLSMYVKAILERDLSLLIELKDSDRGGLYHSIVADFERDEIAQTDLIEAYKVIFDVDHSSRKVMESIRMIEPTIFSKEKMQKGMGGQRKYKLPKVR